MNIRLHTPDELRCTLVELPGHGRLWLNPLMEGLEGQPLSHLDECDKDGNLIVPEGFLTHGVVHISYACLMTDGRIMRMGKQIGSRSDLKEIKAT